MTYKEDDIEQVYEKIREKEDAKETSLQKALQTQKTYFFFVIGALVITTYIGLIERNTAIIIGFVGALFFYFSIGGVMSGRELTEQELKVKLAKQLRYKQIHPLNGEYQISPSLKIKIQDEGRRMRINGKAEERITAVKFFDPSTADTVLKRYTQDLFSGDITGCSTLQYGMSDLNAMDVKIIESEGLRNQKHINKYLDVGGKQNVKKQSD